MKTMGTLKLGAQRYRVQLADEGEAELEGNMGLCDHEKRTITVQDGMSAPETLDTLVHEIEHGLLAETGLRFVLFGHLEDIDRRTEAEEHFIRVLTPHIIDLITQMRRPGWTRRLNKMLPGEKK